MKIRTTVRYHTTSVRIIVVQLLSSFQFFETPTSITRLTCPTLSPRVCPSSCPLSQWCYPTVSSSATLFFFLQPFPTSGSFPMSQMFTSGGQNFGASASVLLMNIQNWLHLRLTGLISFQESFPTPQFESINSLGLSLLYGPTIRDYVYFVGSPYPGLLIVSQ